MISSCAKILRYFIGIFFISCFVNRMPVFCLPRGCGAFSSSPLISFGLALKSDVNTCLVKVSAASCKTSAVAEPRCSSLTFAVPITRKMLPICSSVIFLLVEIFWSKITPLGCILPRRGKANFAGGALMLAAAPKCLPLFFPKSSARYSSRRCAARCFSGVFSFDISPYGCCILPYFRSKCNRFFDIQLWKYEIVKNYFVHEDELPRKGACLLF